MPKLNVRMSLPLLILTAALAGCAKNGGDVSNGITHPGGSTGNGAAMEEAAVASSMSEAPQLVEDGIMETEAETDLGSGLIAGEMNALIRPLRFWRKIEHVERRFEFAFADTDTTGRPTTAVVTVHKRLLGTFNILAGDPPAEPVVTEGEEPGTPPDTTLRLVRKRLDDRWVRRLLLKRVPPPPGDELAHHDGRPRWRIAATSGVKITSREATTNIVSLRVQCGPLDTLITNPLDLFRLRRVLHFPADARVHLTVTTERNDDVVLLYRGGGRLRFHNNGDNTYSGGFLAAWASGTHHFGVNALSRGTLFDDALPYDSEAWALPYVVAPTMLAEYLP
ncbi:MAG: hypothetical protein ABIS67_10960 [Candidatus Eisenbacteria bacterium]